MKSQKDECFKIKKGRTYKIAQITCVIKTLAKYGANGQMAGNLMVTYRFC